MSGGPSKQTRIRGTHGRVFIRSSKAVSSAEIRVSCLDRNYKGEAMGCPQIGPGVSLHPRAGGISVRRPASGVQGVTPSPPPPFLGIGLEAAAAAFRWIRLIKCGERESGVAP